MTTGLKRNINIGLLILIVALVFCFVAATVYYQMTFVQVSKNAKTKLSELQKVTSTLLQKKEELATTSAQKETLESKYTDIREAKESVEDELSDTQSELDSTKNELLQTKEDLRKEKDLSALYISQRDEYKAQRDAYLSDLNGVCDSWPEGTAKPSDCPE
jgi:septal ring factor EnvC (AmiA/AmiB activator)